MKENDFYFGLYRDVQDKGLAGWYVRQAHLALEQTKKTITGGGAIIEVGGNIGEHIPFVEKSFYKYTLTDYRDTGFVTENPKIIFQIVDVHKTPYSDNSFDRVIATCLLHHLDHPIIALQEIRRIVKAGGLVSISLPCDPGFAYRMAKKWGVSKRWKKSGINNPEYFHYSQHKNHYPAIDSYIKEIFREDKIDRKFWPFQLNSWNLNLFATYQITKGSTK